MNSLLENKYIVRIIGGLLYLALVVWLGIASVRQGLSEYAANRATANNSVAEATRAVSYDATNPETYRIRGLILLRQNKYREAIGDLNQATALRPNDYPLWLQLGYANYQARDFAAARNAYDRASSLAPGYAPTQQYLGYLSMMQNDSEQGFAHFRKSAELDPKLFPTIINLARQNFGDDAEAIERALQPAAPEDKRQLAEYFIDNKMMSPGISEFLTGIDLDDKSKRDFVSRFIEKKDFSTAYKIWASQNSRAKDATNESVVNGGFENAVDGTENGFGWRFKPEKNIALSIESKDAFSGAASLRIKFDGNSDPATIIISHLAIVAPNQKYRLEFAARSLKLTSGGLPLIQITDANSNNLLGQSMTVNPDANDWQKYRIDFAAGEQTEAVMIVVRRKNCTVNPCPAFGDLWLDEFALKKI